MFLIFKIGLYWSLNIFSFLPWFVFIFISLTTCEFTKHYLTMWDTYTVTKNQNIVQLQCCCIYLSLKSNIQITLELLVIRGKRLSPYVNFEFSFNVPKVSNDQVFQFYVMVNNTFLRSLVTNFLRYIFYFKIYTFDSVSNFQMWLIFVIFIL